MDVESLIERHLGERRPDVGHPAGERAALDDDDVALLDAVLGPLVEHDDAARLQRLAADHPRRDRLVLEPALELDERGELLVLGADGLQPRVLVGEPLVLVAQRRVLGPQLVDLADRPGDARHRLGDVGDRALERPQGERQAALELAHVGVRRERHQQQRDRDAGS